MPKIDAPEDDLGERLLRIRDVEKKVGMSGKTIYRRMAAGRFPLPVQDGEYVVRWRQSDIDRYIDGLPLATRKVPNQNGPKVVPLPKPVAPPTVDRRKAGAR